MLALAEGFAGYSLPDDLLSGTGLRIAQGIMLSIPVVGTYISMFVFGGESRPGHRAPAVPGAHPAAPRTAARAGHAPSDPRVHRHHPVGGRGRTNRNAVGNPMFPQFMTNSTGLFLMVFGS
ncbi:Cytochrome bc1 complex cytochrome b subunit OS=Streptomyces griseomycini OX=66895 GN=FHS37_000394 PE=4 SV=1 [Streptomyces griseomycini]